MHTETDHQHTHHSNPFKCNSYWTQLPSKTEFTSSNHLGWAAVCFFFCNNPVKGSAIANRVVLLVSFVPFRRVGVVCLPDWRIPGFKHLDWLHKTASFLSPISVPKIVYKKEILWYQGLYGGHWASERSKHKASILYIWRQGLNVPASKNRRERDGIIVSCQTLEPRSKCVFVAVIGSSSCG